MNVVGEGYNTETTQTFTKICNMLYIMFRPKVRIFVRVWVVSVLLFQAPHVQGHFEIWKQVFTKKNSEPRLALKRRQT